MVHVLIRKFSRFLSFRSIPGMVTSNVRHSRRALVAPPADAAPPVEREVSDIIPSLNFSIPIARLQPLWDFVETSGAR